jgi:hypothetical protein
MARFTVGRDVWKSKVPTKCTVQFTTHSMINESTANLPQWIVVR